MNSFYGVLGTPACRFFNPRWRTRSPASAARCCCGRSAGSRPRASGALRRHRQPVRAFGARRSGRGARRSARARGALNAELARDIAERWRVQSRLELEFERLYLRLFLPHARGSARGASKRYAGLVHGGEPRDVEFSGMEVVRRDWTALAKQVQRELYGACSRTSPSRLPRGDRAAGAGRRARRRARLPQGPAQGRRRLHRDHAAARRRGAQIDAAAGPAHQLRDDDRRRRAARQRQHPLDREHYVAKQVRPVAEPVLETLGLDFERVIGDGGRPRCSRPTSLHA